MNPLEPFRQGKYLSLETFRRDGTGVSTPVWFVTDAGRLYCRSDPSTHKVRRFRANPSVTVAPCNLRGTEKGPRVPARVEPVDAGEWPKLERLYAEKYRLEAFLAKLPFGGPPGTGGDQVYYEIVFG